MTPVTLTLPAGRHEVEARGIGGPRTATVEVVAGQSVSQSFAFGIASLSGSLKVTSRVAKVEVLVDGESKGMAPLTMDNLPLGIHTVTLRGPKGESQHEVTIEAAKTAMLDTAETGWVHLQSPINLQVQEKGVVIGTAAGGPIPLSPGVHRLDFAERRARLPGLTGGPGRIWPDGRCHRGTTDGVGQPHVEAALRRLRGRRPRRFHAGDQPVVAARTSPRCRSAATASANCVTTSW